MCTELVMALVITLHAQGIEHALEQREREHAACMFAHYCTPLGTDSDVGQCFAREVKEDQPRMMDSD